MTKAVVALVVLASFLAWVSAQTSSCPYCVDLDCGPDGEGGSCGSCPFGQRCSRGKCICDRGCTGRECGPDSCGTTCGECLPGQTCVNGLCTGACTPQCTRDDGTIRTCGWDRCGGCCGRCPEGFRCRDGVCECYPNCENKHCGPDGCGGECGTCVGDRAFCQGASDPFPQQCKNLCDINLRVEVREEVTDRHVTEVCTVSVSGPSGFSQSGLEWNGPAVPSGAIPYITLEVGDFGEGSYNFNTNCPGYELDTEVHVVTGSSDQLITIYVVWKTVQIEVRDEQTNALLPTATISITSTGYALDVDWVSPIYTWTHNGFQSYTFATSSPGYEARTVGEQVTAETTLITLYLGIPSMIIIVEECVTGDLIQGTATITVSGATYTYPNDNRFQPVNGFTSYTFNTEASGYIGNTQTVAVTTETTQIVLCVNYAPIPVRVTSCATGQLIDGATVVATSNFYSSYSLTFTHSSSGTTWTPVGFQGTYSFAGSASGYEDAVHTTSVSPSTEAIEFCLPESEFCGNGNCGVGESAHFARGACFDCGRIRGTISLALGQKDQLPDITVSVWAAPYNPAVDVVANRTRSLPDFNVTSDTKGAFSIDNLNFQAPRESAGQGQYKRRWYFSLSGSFRDRSSGADIQVDLLDLWWNYELTNTQWQGEGSLTNSNTSPQFYFYMTPGFQTSDALVRVILSWGTRISQPGSTIRDLDLMVAGPVDTAGRHGIVNFQSKEDSSNHAVLPYAELITDSAQGFGPEVIDFYGVNSNSIGFASTYGQDNLANVYEIWVDRPNSAQNELNSGDYVADTNAFIIFYFTDANNPRNNRQAFFMETTGVEYAYGFYNGDQWNQVPATATMWHIVDIGQGVPNNLDAVHYDNFPTGSEAPGTKYSFASSSFENTRLMPCGHSADRGASPSPYCPYTINYPGKK